MTSTIDDDLATALHEQMPLSQHNQIVAVAADGAGASVDVSDLATHRPLSPTPRVSAARSVGELGTILSVWAHPDDEAYLSAGLMRLALENGQRVVCVTATKGELGTSDPLTWPPERLTSARSVELAASLAVIADGLDDSIEHHWLEHRDGGCAEIRPEIGAAQIADLLDRVQPDTVITFDAGGVTGHTDHQAVAEWTSIAVRERPEIVQLDAVIPQSYVDHFDGRLDLDPFFYDGYPQPVADETLHLGLVLDDELWGVKDRALRAHATQTDGVNEMFSDAVWKDFNVIEAFTKRADRPPPNHPTNQPSDDHNHNTHKKAGTT